MVTLLLIDDEYLVRMGICETIEWSKYDIEIIGTCPNGVQGLEMAIKNNPDIIITDIRMPIMDGLEFMSKVKENGLNPKIIVLSGFDDFEYARTAMHYGAIAYLLKPVDNHQLLETVRKIAKVIISEKGSQQYLIKLKEELSSIKRQFLIDLITGYLNNKEDILERILFLDIPIEHGNNYILTVKIDEFSFVSKQLPLDVLLNFKTAIKTHISDLLLINSIFKGIVFSKAEDEYVIILNINEPLANAVDIIKSFCIEITERLKSKYNYPISIGIGNCYEDILAISKSYTEAITASEYKILQGNSSVIFIKQIDSMGYRREIRDAIKFIKSNYSKDISIEITAKSVYISPSYLMHLFKHELGKTFNECLTDYRIFVAKELLKNPKLKIYEISKDVGYGDVKYFSQIFKKITGITPTDYIKYEL